MQIKLLKSLNIISKLIRTLFIRIYRIIKKVLKSNTVQFVIVRYISYGLIFLNSLLLAKYLGSFYFGIYGFIMLFLQYLRYTNFGINHSLNTILAIKKNKKALSQLIWSTSLVLNIIVSLVIFLTNIIILKIFPEILSKYDYTKYGTILILIGIISNTNNLFLGLYRIYSKLSKINFQLFFPQFLVFLLLLIYKKELKIDYVLYALISANIISLFVFIISPPLRINLRFNKSIAMVLFKRGVNLLLYNLSYNFIITASATIVSIFYAVTTFGQYKFAQSISAATVMATGAFAFIFFPKILNRFSVKNIAEIIHFIKKMNNIYVSALNLLSFLALLVAPFIQIALPEYIEMLNVYKLLIIAQIFANLSQIHQIFLISKNKEKFLNIYGFLAIGIVVFSSLIFSYLKFSYEFIALSVVFGSFLYSYLSIRKSSKLLNQNFKKMLAGIINIRLVIPILLIVISIFLNENTVTPIIILSIFILLNLDKMRPVFRGFISIINNNDIIDF